MKRFATLLLLCAFVATAMAQHTYVLVAGVSTYNEPGLKNPPITDDDAKAIHAIFKESSKKNVSAGLITSKYVTSTNIEKRLNAIIKVAKPEDTIIFYYCGHGDKGSLYLYNGESYNYLRLCNVLTKAKTKNIFCIIEACYSGSSAYAARQSSSTDGKKVTFLVSSNSTETSRYETELFQHGYFSAAVAKGLRGFADANSDKRITLRELYNYIYKDVVRRYEGSSDTQHPQLIGEEEMFDKVVVNWNRK